MKIKLWVDDERNEPLGWLRVSDYDNAIEVITAYADNLEAISFDHDIGISGNGARVAGYVEKLANENKLPTNIKFNIHSANPQGCININSILGRVLKLWGRDEIITQLKASIMWDDYNPGWHSPTGQGRIRTRKLTEGIRVN